MHSASVTFDPATIARYTNKVAVDPRYRAPVTIKHKRPILSNLVADKDEHTDTTSDERTIGLQKRKFTENNDSIKDTIFALPSFKKIKTDTTDTKLQNKSPTIKPHKPNTSQPKHTNTATVGKPKSAPSMTIKNGPLTGASNKIRKHQTVVSKSTLSSTLKTVPLTTTPRLTTLKKTATTTTTAVTTSIAKDLPKATQGTSVISKTKSQKAPTIPLKMNIVSKLPPPGKSSLKPEPTTMKRAAKDLNRRNKNEYEPDPIADKQELGPSEEYWNDPYNYSSEIQKLFRRRKYTNSSNNLNHTDDIMEVGFLDGEEEDQQSEQAGMREDKAELLREKKRKMQKLKNKK